MRCSGCEAPWNPQNGNWDCDSTQNGQSVCMLQCKVVYHPSCNCNSHSFTQEGFKIKGRHIIACDVNTGKLLEDPTESVCEESDIPSMN